MHSNIYRANFVSLQFEACFRVMGFLQKYALSVSYSSILKKWCTPRRTNASLKKEKKKNKATTAAATSSAVRDTPTPPSAPAPALIAEAAAPVSAPQQAKPKKSKGKKKGEDDGDSDESDSDDIRFVRKPVSKKKDALFRVKWWRVVLGTSTFLCVVCADYTQP